MPPAVSLLFPRREGHHSHRRAESCSQVMGPQKHTAPNCKILAAASETLSNLDLHDRSDLSPGNQEKVAFSYVLKQRNNGNTWQAAARRVRLGPATGDGRPMTAASSSIRRKQPGFPRAATDPRGSSSDATNRRSPPSTRP